VTREQVQKLIEEAAARFAKSHEPHEQQEVARLTVILAELHSIEVLTGAVARCQGEDIRTEDLYEALDFLESRVAAKWPFEQFRNALNNKNKQARWQFLKGSLNGIKQSLERGPLSDEILFPPDLRRHHPH
jgi:hypothetical protein